MKEFFGSKTLMLIAAVLVIVIVMSFVTILFSGSASPVANITGVLLTPFRSASAAVSGFFGDIYSYIYEFDALKQENSELKAQIAKMEEDIRNSTEALEESARLRALHNLAERRRDFEYVMANIVSWNSSNWTSSFTLSKGSLQGIKAFDCVINEEGFLVGQVTEVGTNWAVVTTLIDSSAEMGAVIGRTGVTAVCEGDFELMGDGFLKLTYLPQDAIVLNGDVVLTSGIGGVFPSDLVIGSAQELRPGAGGVGGYAVIKPAVSLSSLTQVFVVTAFDITE